MIADNSTGSAGSVSSAGSAGSVSSVSSVSSVGSVDDVVEINQLLARYAVTITQGDIPALIGVFTEDGTYSAFGDTYPLSEFPALVAAAPKGLFLTGTALVSLDESGSGATGTQPVCFIDHHTHEMRIGYYNDTYLRTASGWRLRTRAMTFIRRNGAHDSGRPHAYQPEKA